MEWSAGVVFIFITFAVFQAVTPKADFARLQKIKPWNITVKDNGYNILIGISEEIPASQGPRLIENMKRMMRKASEKLHSITSGKASFSSITFVVPNTWTGYTKYSNGQTVSKANFYIRAGDASNIEPEVQKYLKGTSKNPYRAIVIPSTYVERNAFVSNVGNVILEKWFALQYGVVRSYNELLNEIAATGTCNDPAEENLICLNLRTDLDWSMTVSSSTPTFEVVRQRSKRVVMIVDVSGSMSVGSRLDKAKSGLKEYIINQEEKPGVSLGIVKFSTEAQTLSNLTNNRAEKVNLRQLVDGLRVDTQTSIGAGLQRALEVLNRHPEETNGAEFILLSDGKETSPPFINQTSSQVIRSKVTVHTIAITDDADTGMDGLGAATGGLAFIHKDIETGNDIGAALSSISQYDETDPASSGIVIYSEEKTTVNPTFTILIDELIGRDTSFVFECPYSHCQVSVEIDAPDQKDFIRYQFFSTSEYLRSANYEIVPKSRAGQLDIIIPDAKAGSWNVRTVYSDGSLGLTVKTFPRDISNYPILAFSFWGKDQIFADECADDQTMYTLITRDNNPVIGAEVTATVESSTGTYGPYPLYDDGKGRDETMEDGIYTGVFPDNIRNLAKTERFSLKVRVNGTTATQVRTRLLVAASPRGTRPSMQPGPAEPVERLQRYVLGGSFISMKQASDACKVCNLDMVFLFYSPTQSRQLKVFLYGIITFYLTSKNARVQIGIVDASTPDDVIAHPTMDIMDTVSSLTAWIPKSSSSSRADFATGLKTAEGIFNNDDRRKAIVLISDTDTYFNVQEALIEADRLKERGIHLIPVGVKGTPSFLGHIARAESEIVRLPDYQQPSGKDAEIINRACGFSLIPAAP